MKYRLILTLLLALSLIDVSAQRITIHLKDGTTKSFQTSDIEKLSFENTAVDNIHLIKHQGALSGLSIYNLSGKLIRKINSSDGVAEFDIQALPPGIYIVKDGDRSYKLIKQ